MAVPGSVIFLDTLARFLPPGADENSSKDMRAFADTLFALLKKGAASIVVLHHTPKNAGDAMSLESALRGSGDLGAFLTCCWGTRLQDPARPYESLSYLENLKQRDFSSTPIEVTCGPDLRMQYAKPNHGNIAVLTPRRAYKGNVDGMEEAAIALLKENAKLSIREISALLKERGIKRGKTWVSERRYELIQANGGKMNE
jgi:hypothetical protein